MLRFALRRLYVGLTGMMLLTSLLVAGMRMDLHSYLLCSYPSAAEQGFRGCEVNDAPIGRLARAGTFYAVWQTGFPPQDYWPLAAVLLASGMALDLVAVRRSEWRGASPR